MTLMINHILGTPRSMRGSSGIRNAWYLQNIYHHGLCKQINILYLCDK